MTKKNICLISRSVYPHPISKHTQNMQTFEGWMRFWENVVILSQSKSKQIQTSRHKNIYGVLLPLFANKYLNVFYFTFFGFLKIRLLNKKYNFEVLLESVNVKKFHVHSHTLEQILISNKDEIIYICDHC